ncbi:glycosyltransferase family 2 protein [Virgibacillus dakarensis]|nr:glycosyltransferase family 2 protein [Virgibacillus dakarensis]
MKDITAILVQYTDQALLQKALVSLKEISSRLESIIVVQAQNSSFQKQQNWFEQVQLVTSKNNDLGKTLNTVIDGITSPYVLFLHDSDYLTANINDGSLHIPNKKTVLATQLHHRNIVTHWPLLVLTVFLKQEHFMSSYQLPFKEALFPAWLSKMDPASITMKEGIVKQARKNNAANTIEKQQFIQKYQQQKMKTDQPSITVLLANYNMGKYVETAIASCFMQSEQPQQVLVIDDGSTDNSLEQLKCWDNGKQVLVFRKTNGGKARALNDLLPHVTSDFIVELDADDWLDPDAISVIKQNLSDLPNDVSVLYGNLRRWKQLKNEVDVLFKGVAKGKAVNGLNDLLGYRFPLGPRIYRTSFLQKAGGFPVITFENGRLYEDVSVLCRLIKDSRFSYRDFTVYNIREHQESITKINNKKWNDFIKLVSID